MLLAIQKNQLNHQAHQNLQQGKPIYCFLSISIFNVFIGGYRRSLEFFYCGSLLVVFV